MENKWLLYPRSLVCKRTIIIPYKLNFLVMYSRYIYTIKSKKWKC